MSQLQTKGAVGLGKFAMFLGVASAIAATTSSAQSFNFEDRAYTSPEKACAWNGQALPAGYKNGFTFKGFNALDLNDYLFSNSANAEPGHCFVNGRVHDTQYSIDAAYQKTGYQGQLGAFNSSQSAVLGVSDGSGTYGFSNATGFYLDNILLGAGWGNVETLKLTGFLGGSEVWTQSFTFLGLGGATSTFSKFEWIDHLSFDVTYATGNDIDPYKSIEEQVGYGYTNPNPYQTFFIDNIAVSTSTVPEPTSIALMGIGLVGLGVAARRKKGAKSP